MQLRWARLASIVLLLFSGVVLLATLVFLWGDPPAAPAPASRPPDVTVKVVQLDPAVREAELQITLAEFPQPADRRLVLSAETETVVEVQAPVVTARVPVRTQPQSFPDDFYELGLKAFLLSPERRVGLYIHVLPNDHLADWRQDSRSGEHAQVALQRPGHVRYFVYGVAIAPLLLGLSAGLHWLHDRSSRTAPIELAAALLALLPLRDVLVPDDIPGITRLDHLLGGEVVAISVGVAVVTAIALWRRPRPPSAPAEVG